MESLFFFLYTETTLYFCNARVWVIFPYDFDFNFVNKIPF